MLRRRSLVRKRQRFDPPSRARQGMPARGSASIACDGKSPSGPPGQCSPLPGAAGAVNFRRSHSVTLQCRCGKCGSAETQHPCGFAAGRQCGKQCGKCGKPGAPLSAQRRQRPALRPSPHNPLMRSNATAWRRGPNYPCAPRPGGTRCGGACQQAGRCNRCALSHRAKFTRVHHVRNRSDYRGHGVRITPVRRGAEGPMRYTSSLCRRPCRCPW